MRSSSSFITERKESVVDDVSRGEEGVGDQEHAESDAGGANWTMMCNLVSNLVLWGDPFLLLGRLHSVVDLRSTPLVLS